MIVFRPPQSNSRAWNFRRRKEGRSDCPKNRSVLTEKLDRLSQQIPVGGRVGRELGSIERRLLKWIGLRVVELTRAVQLSIMGFDEESASVFCIGPPSVRVTFPT